LKWKKNNKTIINKLKIMITKKELKNYSENIQIALKDEQIERLLKQLNDIVDYVSILEKYNFTEKIDENSAENNQFFMTNDCNRMREDVPKNSVSLQDSLKNAPRKNDNFFKVPKVIE
jgi:aspartyl-tRNA(Asn)/glutamyl-tRNA(Gln) amidotransferase subunit C